MMLQNRRLVKKTNPPQSVSAAKVPPASCSVSTPTTCRTLSKPALLPVSTVLQRHQQKWKNCTGCALHLNRNQVVTFRGDAPCDVLLIGEAPGRSEDFLGQPFVGESGYILNDLIKLCFSQHCRIILPPAEEEFDMDFSPYRPPEVYVDRIICTANPHALDMVEVVWKQYPPLRVGISNICCCLPLGDPEVEGGLRPLRAPNKTEALACRPRLLELIQIVKPKAIVSLGKEPAALLPKTKDGLPPSVRFVENVIHPSALARLQSDNPIRYQESWNRCVLTLNRVKRRLWGLED